MPMNFMSAKDSKKTRTMHTLSHNIEIMMGNETYEIIKKNFKSNLQSYQKYLEILMRGSEFFFSDVDLLYYDLQNINLNRGG